ncbi:hypothetical protein, partial [Shewanella phaeophyticola]
MKLLTMTAAVALLISISPVKADEWLPIYQGENGTLESHDTYPQNYKYTSPENTVISITSSGNDLRIRFTDDSYRHVDYYTEEVVDVSKPIYNPDPEPPGGGMPLSIMKTGSYSTNTNLYNLTDYTKPNWNITSANKTAYEKYLLLMQDIEELQLPKLTPKRTVIDEILQSLPAQYSASSCEYERGKAAIGYEGSSNAYLCSVAEGIAYTGMSVTALLACYTPGVNVATCSGAISAAVTSAAVYISAINRCQIANADAQHALEVCEANNDVPPQTTSTEEPPIN